MHLFSPWLALLIVFVYSHKFCDRYTFLFSQQPTSYGQPPSYHRLWFPIGFREANLSLITTLATETALGTCLWSRPAIMGNHLGSWVGQPWAKDTQWGSLGNIEISWNLGYSVEPPDQAYTQPHTFHLFEPINFLFCEGRLCCLSCYLQWIPPQLTQLRFHGAHIFGPITPIMPFV